MEWLNGPLVWAIDAWHAPMYLFPRECPRILVWPTPETNDSDRERWFDTDVRMIAYVEMAWLERIRVATLCRYTFTSAGFENIEDAGMWVSRHAVTPIDVTSLNDLPARLRECDVLLRPVENLLPLKPVWNSSLHASGIRLRNARDWGEPGWPHSTPRRRLQP